MLSSASLCCNWSDLESAHIKSIDIWKLDISKSGHFCPNFKWFWQNGGHFSWFQVVGYCGNVNGEWAVWAEARGDKERVSVLKNWGEHSSSISNKKQMQHSWLRTLCSTNYPPFASTNTAHSPSLCLASRNSPRTTFSNCTRNDVTTVCPR